MIFFQTPLISQEPGRSGSSALEPILESSSPAPEASNLQGSQTPVFGTPSQAPDYNFNEDPWQDTEQPNAHVPSETYRSRIRQFDYGAMLWQAIYEGQDPWSEP